MSNYPTIFWLRFWPNLRCSWWTKTTNLLTNSPNLINSSLFGTPLCRLEIINAQMLPLDKFFPPIFHQLGPRLSLFVPSIDSLADVGFGWYLYFWIACNTYFPMALNSQDLELGMGSFNFGKKSTQVISLTVNHFSIMIPTKQEMLSMNQKNQVIVEKLA